MNLSSTLNIETLNQVVENIGNPVILCDKEGNLLSWNSAASEMIHVNIDEASKNSWGTDYEFYSPYSNRKISPENIPMMQALRGIVSKNIYVIVKKRDLEDKHLSVNAYPIVDADNNIIAAFTEFTDVSDKVKMKALINEFSERFDHIKKLLEDSVKLEATI